MKLAIREHIRRWRDHRRSRDIDISGIHTVCLALGPYRNLSTLTGSILFLHPHCQVLNHGGPRVFGNPRVDFVGQYSEERFNEFLRYAVYISTSGRRGLFGGSIRHSHAFDESHSLSQVYSKYFGDTLRKPDIRALFWKEPQITANRMRESGFDLDMVLAQEPRLRFMMPIRNPLDCATSGAITGHCNYLPGIDRQSTFEDVLTAIVDEYAWFIGLKARHPGRFHYFLENDSVSTILAGLLGFMRLEDPPGWSSAVQSAFEVKGGYNHNRARIALLESLVTDRLADFPEFAESILRLADPTAAMPADGANRQLAQASALLDK